MDIRWLKTFIIAAKHENFRITSEELFLTQPAITKHIKRLEENLNIELFNRVGKNVTLTVAGHTFLPIANDIVVRYEQGMLDFEAWKQGYNRKLIIATAPQIASSFLPSLLRTFIDENPDIEVVIDVVKSYNIGEEISSGKADIGLTRIQPVQTNIKSEIIHEEPVILVVPFTDNRNELDEKSILHKYRLITYNHPEYWHDLLNEAKRNYPTIRTMAVNQVEITKRFIEEGLGVSYLPLSMVKTELDNNKLIKVKPEKVNPPFSSTYVLSKVATNEVTIFIKFLKSAIHDFA